MSFFSKRRYDPNDSEYAGGGGATWSVTCKSDPRFNMSGLAYGTWDAMTKSTDAIKAKIAELRLAEDKVPTNIEYSGGKL